MEMFLQFRWLLCIGAGIVVGCSNQQPATNVPQGFAITAMNGDVLVSNKDIVSYNWTTHTIWLRGQTKDRLFRTQQGDMLQGIPFVVTVDQQEIYRGNLVTGVSSNSNPTAVIVDHHFVYGQSYEVQNHSIRIEWGYPTPAFAIGTDPRGDPRILDALTAVGKLFVNSENSQVATKAAQKGVESSLSQHEE
jgi:hypothetical protein